MTHFSPRPISHLVSRWTAIALAMLVIAALSMQSSGAVTQADSLAHPTVLARQLTSKQLIQAGRGNAIGPTSSGSQSVSAAGTKMPATLLPCTPETFQSPAPLDTALLPVGLSTVVDQAQTYAVHGDTTMDIARQLANCSPKLISGEDFVGFTSYVINWEYSFQTQPDGQCIVTQPKIGLHIGEVLPNWQSLTDSATTTGKWQQFSNALQQHEAGHIALDKQYGSQLLQDMQQLPAMPCDTIGNLLSDVMSHDLAVLSQANDNYDAQTDHGATQGAIFTP